MEPVIGGVYRHFKGGYYVVRGCEFDVDTSEMRVSYFRVCEEGETVRTSYSRRLDDFMSEVPESGLNVTGQRHRFELVSSTLSMPSPRAFTTASLLEELSLRVDNPYRNAERVLDVVTDDYALVISSNDSDEGPIFVYSTYETYEKAVAAKMNMASSRYKVMRRLFVRTPDV